MLGKQLEALVLRSTFFMGNFGYYLLQVTCARVISDVRGSCCSHRCSISVFLKLCETAAG